MRAAVASPLGLLIGLSLGALGGGGSILAVPALVYVAGQSVRAATTSSLVVVGAASAIGMVRHLRAGRVRVGAGTVFGLCGVGGSIAGSALNRRLDPDVLLLAFSGLVMVAAWRMVTGCPTCTRVGERRATTTGAASGLDGGTAAGSGDGPVRTAPAVDVVRTALEYATAGTGVGFFTGLFGVGGGFVIVPALTLLLRFAMPEAIGTSLLVIAINSVVALAVRLEHGVEWSVTLPFAVAAVTGVVAGSRVADRLPAATSLRWFAALLVAVGLYTAVRSALAL
jgi:uncharacterized membrane protein YfcA